MAFSRRASTPAKLALTSKAILEYHTPPIFTGSCRLMMPAVRNSLVLLLVIAFAIRLAAGWAWQSRLDGRFGMGDSESYWALALRHRRRKALRVRVGARPGLPHSRLSAVVGADSAVGRRQSNRGSAWPAPRPRCWASWRWPPCGGSRDCCSTIAPRSWRRRWRHSIRGNRLKRVDPQRGAVLSADVAATRPLDRRLEGPS